MKTNLKTFLLGKKRDFVIEANQTIHFSGVGKNEK